MSLLHDSDVAATGRTSSTAREQQEEPQQIRNRGRRISTTLSRVLVSSGVTRDSKLAVDAPLHSHVAYLVLNLILHIFYLAYSSYHWVLYYYHRFRTRLSMVASYHNRTPQLIRSDVVDLEKIPRHVAVILDLKAENEEGGGIDGLLDQTGEISAWCVGAGVSVLTIYERRGVLKSMPVHDLYRAVSHKLESYFGVANRPTFRLTVPHTRVDFSNGDVHDEYQLEINLVSLSDGRGAIVELSRTLADLAVNHQLSSKDLSLPLINQELCNILEEPDLVILFSPSIDLQGFPPWQIRLSEIFYLPDNDEVSYVVFLKALQKYANCKINVGR